MHYRARLLDYTEIPYRVTVQIFDKSLFAGDPSQPSFKTQLNTSYAMTINIGEAQNLSCDLTRWIVTSVFTLPVNTGDVLSQHLPRKVRVWCRARYMNCFSA